MRRVLDWLHRNIWIVVFVLFLAFAVVAYVNQSGDDRPAATSPEWPEPKWVEPEWSDENR
jgi:hypothetical protein